MEIETVVFFYVLEKQEGRKFFWQTISFKIQEMVWNDRNLIAIGIPEYHYPKRKWKKDVLYKKICTELSCQIKGDLNYSTFLCHRSMIHEKNFLEVLQKLYPLPFVFHAKEQDYGFTTPEEICRVLISKHCVYDALVLIDDEENLNPEWVESYCHKINYFAVITKKEEKYQEVFEKLEEEYGLIPIVVENLEELYVPVKSKTLVIDVKSINAKEIRNLPTGCTYFDFHSFEKKQKIIEGRRKDIHYLSFYKLIDKKLRQKLCFSCKTLTL